MKKTDHKCFCKSCVPSPACKVKLYEKALQKISKSIRAFENIEVIKIADKALKAGCKNDLCK